MPPQPPCFIPKQNRGFVQFGVNTVQSGEASESDAYRFGSRSGGSALVVARMVIQDDMFHGVTGDSRCRLTHLAITQHADFHRVN